MKDSIPQTTAWRYAVQGSLLAGLLSLGVISLAAGEEFWPPETLFPLQPEETLELPLPAVADRSHHSFVRQPLAFERNDGQTASEVAFLSRGRGYTLFLARNETVLKLCNADFPVGTVPFETPAVRNADFPVGDSGRLENRRYDVGTDDPPAGERGTDSPAKVLRMRLSGANPQPAIEGEQCLRAQANYFIGNQPSLWRTNIPTFGKVRYKEVYPGIDLVYYGNEGQLEYDFIVAPGAEPNRIAMEFEGADEMRLDEHGDLLLKAGDREVRWQKPFIFQEVSGVRQEIAGTYRLGTGQSAADAQDATVQSLHFVSFTLAAYDAAMPLVIDPRLVYSTYLGGSGDETGHAVALDNQGNVYVAGNTTSIDFPTKNPLNNAYSGGAFRGDVFVTKLNQSGQVLFSTYLGGSDTDDYEDNVQIAVGSEGQCYVAGTTISQDFPVVNALQENYGGGDRDAYVAAVSANGSALLFSTYLGGNDRDGALAVSLGPTGDVYVVGTTRSSDFPTRNAFQPQLSPPSSGIQSLDGFITRLQASGQSIIYSTFYGQSTVSEQVGDIKIDSDGNAYVVISVYSEFADTRQSLISKISPNGSSRLFEPRWPASMTQQIMSLGSIALTTDGRVVVAGSPNVANLQAINKPDPNTTLGYSEGYIAMFSATNGTYLSARYFGGSGNESVSGLSVDAAGDIVLAGWTAGPEYQPSGFPVTDPLPDGPEPGKSLDAFVTKFRSTDLSLTFSTLIGRAAAGGLALDSGGNPVVAGSTSGQLPTANAFQPNCAGGGDAFLLKLSFGEKIQISRVGQAVRISWPLSATGFILESADSPSAPVWTVVPTPPVPSGDQNVVTLEIGPGSQFFRLHQL